MLRIENLDTGLQVVKILERIQPQEAAKTCPLPQYRQGQKHLKTHQYLTLQNFSLKTEEYSLLRVHL